MSQIRKPDARDPIDWDVPDWIDPAFDRATPYTEAELDVLVEDTVEAIRDAASWVDLVERVGDEEARRVLRARLIMRDENARRQSRH